MIRWYDEVIPADVCQEARSWIDGQIQEKKTALSFDYEWRRCFSVFLPVEVRALPWAQTLRRVLIEAFERYKKEMPDPTHNLLAHCTHLETLSMLKYRNTGIDRFAMHCDSWNAQTALRQVSLVAYLNTVAEGGETAFERAEHKRFNRTPREGSVLLFPSSWQYPHQGQPTVSNDKYVVVAWFTFDPAKQGFFSQSDPL